MVLFRISGLLKEQDHALFVLGVRVRLTPRLIGLQITFIIVNLYCRCFWELSQPRHGFLIEQEVSQLGGGINAYLQCVA